MKAVGITHYRSVNEDSIFVDLSLPKPEAKGRDLLVAVKAVSVNPVDTKVCKGGGDKVETPPRILGWPGMDRPLVRAAYDGGPFQYISMVLAAVSDRRAAS